jgi:CheY-like chemotaxis protein
MKVVHDQAAHEPVPRILVIQNEEQVRKVVGDALSDRGYDIIEAKTGEEGIRLAHEQPVSLVLLDLRLPELDGFEALGRLRATMRRKLPVVAIGSAVSADLRRIPAAGFDAFQTKPIEIDDLVATVERLLEHR